MAATAKEVDRITHICYRLQDETIDGLAALPKGQPTTESAHLGARRGEPLLVALDGLLRYAKAHQKRYEAPLCDDYALSPPWLEAIRAIRALLMGGGAVALELDRSTDSKDNGQLDALFWTAITVAGYTPEEVL